MTEPRNVQGGVYPIRESVFKASYGPATPAPAGLLREAVWSAQHDATCDDRAPHPWTDHLPWEDADEQYVAEAEADAIIAAVRAALSDPVPLDVIDHRMQRIVERTANMGSCSQTHHEHLAADARKVFAARLSSKEGYDKADHADREGVPEGDLG